MRLLQRKLSVIRKKGISLIEIIVAIAITGIISVAAVSIFDNFYKNYKKEILESRQHFYIEEVFRYIEYEVYGNARGILVKNNELYITKYVIPKENEVIGYNSIKSKFTNTYVNCIKLTGTQLEVWFYYPSNSHDNLLLEVEDFIAQEQNNLVIIKIRMKNGKWYEKCLSTKYLENQKDI
jgi:prepilin-type N-terminal cleavage/methylation domain-containing protein